MMQTSKIKLNKSTSFHVFNADRNNGKPRLNILEKIIWLKFNFINNNLPPKKFKDKNLPQSNIKLKKFSTNIKKSDWSTINKKSTPARMLCDLFWLKINWKKIKSELTNINIFDTGCGDGNYGLKINKYAEGVNSYTGIDCFAYKNWDKLKHIEFFNLNKFSSINFIEKIPLNTNFFMTHRPLRRRNSRPKKFLQ